MTNITSTNPFVYDRLSFPGYYSYRPGLDTEWLLSTLFDASLLSTSKAAGNGGSFFAPSLQGARLRANPESGARHRVWIPGSHAQMRVRPGMPRTLETILSVVTRLFPVRGQ
jgi:hypothetical protein